MKHITIVVPNGIESASSFTSVFEVLDFANEHWKSAGNEAKIEIRLAGFGDFLKLRGGYFSIPYKIQDIKKTDLLVIPSISKNYGLIDANKELIEWIKYQYENGAEIASVCTGSFLLAATGLLDGKRCATHWEAAQELKKLHPNIKVTTEIMTVSADRIYTNGGGFSFLNLALFLVEKYFNRQAAVLCSKMFQIDIDRISQSPYAIFQAQKNHGDELVCRAQTYIEENLIEKISFEKLASKLATSRRNFDRRFIKATGNTPGEYQQRVKVEVAKSAFENGQSSLTDVMEQVGYSDEKAFREVFRKITGLSPLDYRNKYNKEAVQQYTA